MGIKRDRNLISRLFWLFDLNGDENIDNFEFTYSINLFKDYTIEDRVNCNIKNIKFIFKNKSIFRFMR